MTCAGLFGGIDDAERGGGAGRRRRGGHAASASRCSARGSCARSPRHAAGRSRGCAASPGRLARENTVRKPGRTAVTAGALMIGLAVVVFVTRVRRRHQRLGAATRSTATSRATSSSRTPTASRRSARGAGREAARGAGRGDGLLAVASPAAWCGGKDIRVSAVDPEERVRRALARLEEGLARDAVVAVGQPDGAWTTPGRRPTTSTWATRIGVRTPLERDAHLHGDGHGQGQRRPAREPAW